MTSNRPLARKIGRSANAPARPPSWGNRHAAPRLKHGAHRGYCPGSSGTSSRRLNLPSLFVVSPLCCTCLAASDHRAAFRKLASARLAGPFRPLRTEDHSLRQRLPVCDEEALVRAADLRMRDGRHRSEIGSTLPSLAHQILTMRSVANPKLDGG